MNNLLSFLLRRREFLKLFLMGLSTPLLWQVVAKSQEEEQPLSFSPNKNIIINPTILENQKNGTTDWILSNPAKNREIEGYASLTSVNKGAKIQLFVNTKEPVYTIEIFRMGWYQGLGGRRMMEPIKRKGFPQPPPREDKVSGLIECDWQEPYILEIPSTIGDWNSGFYLVKLTAQTSGKQSYIIFVVRDDARASDIVFQSSVTTFQAYNNWGSKSLYRWNSRGKQAYKVSFNRPYAKSPNPKAAYGVGAGEFLTNIQRTNQTINAGWEYNMVRWLEREGYDVCYITNIDTHAHPKLLLKHRVFLSVGHDEYWSLPMRENVEFARDSGVNLGFFSSNTCYWQIRLELSRVTGDLFRTIVAYKELVGLDPYYRLFDQNKPYVTTVWRDKILGKPEESLIGVMYETFKVNGDIMISKDAPTWVLENTGLKPGDKLPGLLGYEVDRVFNHAPKNIMRIGHSPYRYHWSTRYSDMTLYKAISNAMVFATGSMQWVWALDDYNVPQLRRSVLHPGAQQLTRNILNKMLSR